MYWKPIRSDKAIMFVNNSKIDADLEVLDTCVHNSL